MNKILTTNIKRAKWDRDTSPKCTFCGRYDETVKHVLFDCEKVTYTWSAQDTWMKRKKLITQCHGVKVLPNT